MDGWYSLDAAQTRAYVKVVTGFSIEAWAKGQDVVPSAEVVELIAKR